MVGAPSATEVAELLLQREQHLHRQGRRGLGPGRAQEEEGPVRADLIVGLDSVTAHGVTERGVGACERQKRARMS